MIDKAYFLIVAHPNQTTTIVEANIISDTLTTMSAPYSIESEQIYEMLDDPTSNTRPISDIFEATCRRFSLIDNTINFPISTLQDHISNLIIDGAALIVEYSPETGSKIANRPEVIDLFAHNETSTVFKPFKFESDIAMHNRIETTPELQNINVKMAYILCNESVYYGVVYNPPQNRLPDPLKSLCNIHVRGIILGKRETFNNMFNIQFAVFDPFMEGRSMDYVLALLNYVVDKLYLIIKLTKSTGDNDALTLFKYASIYDIIMCATHMLSAKKQAELVAFITEDLNGPCTLINDALLPILHPEIIGYHIP